MDRSASSKIKPSKPASGAPAGRATVTVHTVLDRLDAIDDSRFRNRRGAARHKFRRMLLPVRVRHPGGSISDSRVATRNLSNNGVGFLYNSFLHNGTRVSITLPRKLGGKDVIEGKVVYCQHVAGVFHQIGVRFDQKIFATLYAEDEAKAGDVAGDSTVTAVFGGKLLVIDPQPMDRALVGHHLRATATKVTGVESLIAAVEMLKAGEVFEAVLCELDVTAPGDGIATTFAQLRGAGHSGAIVVGTPTILSPSVRGALIEAGAVAVLTKPYDAGALQAALGQGAKVAGLDNAIAVAEQGIAQVDALSKSIEAATARPAK